MSTIQRTVADYRARLLANEQQAAHQLEHAYAHTLSQVNAQLDVLYRAIDAKQRAGQAIPISWLYEDNRLRTLQERITTEFNAFGHMAHLTTEQLQREAVLLGQHAAQAQLQASVPAGISWVFGQPSASAISNLVGATQKGSPLADLFSGFGQEAAQKASSALITGLTLGDNPRTVATLVEDALNVSRNRALTICRTEQLRAYRESNLENYRVNSAVVGQWQWTASLSTRTCTACLAMDGTLHPLDETFGSHVNCRCVPTPVTKSWSDILEPLGIDTSGLDDTALASDEQMTGAEWLDAQDQAAQKQVLGNKYSGWANGDFTLKDTVGHAYSDEWGHSIYEKSLKELED